MKNLNRTFVLHIDESGYVVFEKGTRPLPDPVGTFERYHAEMAGTTLVGLTVFGTGKEAVCHEREGRMVIARGVQFRINASVESLLISGQEMRDFVLAICTTMQRKKVA